MTQSCGRPFSEDWISGYLDGAISRSDGRRVQTHLRHCAACRRLLSDFREVRDLLSGFHQVGAPDLDRPERLPAQITVRDMFCKDLPSSWIL